MKLGRIFSLILAFIASVSGNVALISAVAMPALLGGGAVALDFVELTRRKFSLQQIADSAALSAAGELKLANATDARIEEVARATVVANLTAAGAEDLASSDKLSIETKVSRDPIGVTVNVNEVWEPFFAQYLDSGVTPIKVTATAQLAGKGAVCVVGLMDNDLLASIHIDNNATLKAQDCGVYSNARSRFGIRLDNSGSMYAQSICSAGGYLKFGQNAVFNPTPTIDCPQIPDPLADRPAPDTSGCNFSDTVVSSNVTLSPGVYCGGLSIEGSASVTLSPGTYVIKNGPLLVKDQAELAGTKSSFYFTGDGSTFYFAPDTTIDLSASETGVMAGLLMYEDRTTAHDFSFNPLAPETLFGADNSDNPNDGVRLHRISSNDARRLIGTIYLKNSVLMIDANAAVADQSAYTALVVARLWLREGPNLVLNADYAATSVPVPNALSGAEIRLTN